MSGETRKRHGGGGRGIRTLETVARLHAFQACAFDHSATPPLNIWLADNHARADHAIYRSGARAQDTAHSVIREVETRFQTNRASDKVRS